MTTSFPRLLADVGGTNARFAWRSDADAPLTDVVSMAVADHPSLEHAAHAYLRSRGKPPPAAAAVGIATPVIGDRVQMTNHDWSFSITALQAALGVQQLRVLNDFTALALALPALAAGDVRQVGGGGQVPGAPIGLIGPGTGLGVSGLICQQPSGAASAARTWLPIAGEGGHVTLAASTDREAQVLAVLRGRYGHVSGERAVSGPGLVSLFEAVCTLTGRPTNPGWTPAAISDGALRGHPTHAAECAETLELLCCFLGTLAADLAVTLGARGGIYIGGGIVPRMGEAFDSSGFRARFEHKGRFSDYLAAIATVVITAAESPALLGADRSLDG